MLGLAVLPGATLALGLAARRWASGPVRLTGRVATALNCGVILALAVNPYTAGGAELFYCVTLVVAAWRAQPGCEATVLSNWALRRDDQVGCPAFTPIDEAEKGLAARATARPLREGAGR